VVPDVVDVRGSDTEWLCVWMAGESVVGKAFLNGSTTLVIRVAGIFVVSARQTARFLRR
jgi:hypothetical protein